MVHPSLIVFLMAIAAVPITIVGMVFRFKRLKLEMEYRRQSGLSNDAGFSANELKHLIEEAVEKGNAPLRERIAQLENAQQQFLNLQILHAETERSIGKTPTQIKQT
ncbi:MAG TPA: hypothetical protein PLL64_01420 [Rhodothermales bacterium]|nr:hypothetical protein [Rhodothermales bacterium]HRR09257.1 hypothetical protein [Rhodothermales bacterium]